MNYGLLWYDGDKQRAFSKKVEDAARRFKNRFGRVPHSCLINAKDAEKLPTDTPNPVMVDGVPVHIASWKGIVPGHLCLGFEVETEPSQSEPTPEPKSDVVSAFEQHARKAPVRQ